MTAVEEGDTDRVRSYYISSSSPSSFGKEGLKVNHGIQKRFSITITTKRHRTSDIERLSKDPYGHLIVSAREMFVYSSRGKIIQDRKEGLNGWS